MTITDTTYAILLYLLDQLTTDEADVLRIELASTHETYMEQLAVLQQTGAHYEMVAEKVKARASVQNRRWRVAQENYPRTLRPQRMII